MRAARLLVLGAMLQCGGGPQNPGFRLEVSAAGATNSDGRARIEMQAGETLLVALVVVGPVPGSVTFTSANLPSFANLDGPMLKLAPARVDQGEYTLTLTATAGGKSQSTSLTVFVQRHNKPPWLGYSFPPIGRIPRYIDVSDDTGVRGLTCPGESCTVDGTPKILLVGCDDDLDAITVEVEVVPRGQAFSKVATHSMSLSMPPDFASCKNFAIALPGLAPERSYEFAVRVSDQFGATAGTTSDGWLSIVHYPEWRFDQGPCSTRQCACGPSGSLACAAAVDCCSGVCDAAVPAYLSTCR